MPQTVQILVSEPTRTHMAAQGWPRTVHFVSDPTHGSTPRRCFMVACLERLAQEEHVRGVEHWMASFRSHRAPPPPLLFLASCQGGGKSYTLGMLQMMVVLSRRTTPSAGSDPYVAPDDASLRRLVLANVHGAEKELISSAAVEAGVLSVWSCEPRLYRCAVEKIPALAELSAEALSALEVSGSGSRIHWSEGDVDINMETIRVLVDPAYRKRNEAKSREDAARYGKAIRALREKLGIAQRGVAGLSDRQVRRLEEGRTVPHFETLKKLAAAHDMPIDEYLAQLAKLSRARRGRRRKAA